MPGQPVRCRSPDEDSGRWAGFAFRDGDTVISTRSKTGTTWVQQICALLIFQTPDLPAPLARLSPWLDFLTVPREEMHARLAAQQHRRFIKTHTPLDGIPLDDRATYIVTARHPLDMAVSLYHQSANIDRERMRQLTGQPAPSGPVRPRRPARDWLLRWTEAECDPRTETDSLAGVLWHLADAWGRRGQPNIVLVHYDDLSADLDGEMRRLAGLLGIAIPEASWPGLVQAATFASMRAGADRVVPGGGVLKSNAAFFRRGTSGAGRELLTAGELARYYARTAAITPGRRRWPRPACWRGCTGRARSRPSAAGDRRAAAPHRRARAGRPSPCRSRPRCATAGPAGRRGPASQSRTACCWRGRARRCRARGARTS